MSEPTKAELRSIIRALIKALRMALAAEGCSSDVAACSIEWHNKARAALRKAGVEL